LKAQPAGYDGGDAPHARLTADLRALIARVGDASTLILDPELDSYYLMDGVLLRLPERADLTAQAAVVQVGASSPLDRAQLTVLSGLLTSNLQASDRGYRVLVGRRPDLRPGLEPLLRASADRDEALVAALDRPVAGAPDAPAQALDAQARAEASLDAGLAYWQRAIDDLDRTLQARIDRAVQREAVVAAVSALALLAVIYLLWGFYASVARTVR